MKSWTDFMYKLCVLHSQCANNGPRDWNLGQVQPHPTSLREYPPGQECWGVGGEAETRKQKTERAGLCSLDVYL
jgi:hypothetical protein